MDEEILKKEKKHLEDTKKIINENILENEKNIEDYKVKAVDAKNWLYHSTHEITDAEMYNFMDEDNLDVDLINDLIKKNDRLYLSLETPYFGRVDFETDKKEKIYIGLTSVEKDLKPVVYDWRAPISNLYYEFELGEGHYKAPDGEVKGNISLKRQYQIKMGKLERYYDVNTPIDDDMLQSVLSTSSDAKMKNIVSTIQKEQNEVIRYNGKTNLIIEGVAGSGKTSVAMHRIAYLLYSEKNLTSKNILIFSPSSIFSEYISDVLPGLGEDNTKVITMNRLAKIYIKDKKVESLTDFIERCYSDDKDEESIKLKTSKHYLMLLDAFLTEYISELHFTKTIGLGKNKITSEELNKIFHETAKRLSISDTLDYVVTYVTDKFNIDEDKNKKKLRRLLKTFLEIKEDPLKIYNEFLIKQNMTPITGDKINYEDIFGILYLHFEINGYPITSHIRHVIIDEAQDYTPLEFILLTKIFRNSIFTILGDKNQNINPYFKYDTLEDLTKIFKDSKYIKLNKAYRSSPEVTNFSNKIIGIKNVKSIRNPNGIDVLQKEGMVTKDDVKYLKDLGMKRIAIITKNNDEAVEVFDNIKDKNTSLVKDSLLKDITILPCYLAKGLEFDGVIVYTSKDNKFTDDEKYLYYVSCTRAQNALIVYNQ